MDNDTFRQMYRVLYERLKGPGLDTLLQSEVLRPGEREAIRMIANLPHPAEATGSQIVAVCTECRSGRLEYVYSVVGIGELAQEILDSADSPEREQTPPVASRPSDDYTLSDVVQRLDATNAMLYDNNFMLRSAQNLLFQVRQQTDYTLKGLCPDCDGDLAMVIEQGANGNLELRLKCYQCGRSGSPPKTRWIVTEVDEQSGP